MKPTGTESEVKNTKNLYGQFIKNIEVDVVFKKLQLAMFCKSELQKHMYLKWTTNMITLLVGSYLLRLNLLQIG